MAYDFKLWLVVHLVLATTYMQHCADGEPQVPCVFILGDSLSDSGNNNNLNTPNKVNYLPYGIDFPNGPTGRFSNGRTVIDLTTQFLGFENFIPPYANTSGWDILQGVNYASGSAGIRNETGKAMGDNISLDLQLEHHKDIVSKITKKLGNHGHARQHLNKCLYYVNVGNNDYINNYCLPNDYPTKSQYPSLQQFAEVLIEQYHQTIRALHELGARKFVLVGLLPVSCTLQIPVAAQRSNASSWLNNKIFDALVFNLNLRSLVDRLNQELSDSKFIYVNNALLTVMAVLDKGVKFWDGPCCKTLTDVGLCVANQTTLCQRDENLFWDSFHFTEAVNQVIAINSYNASNLLFTFPMDVYHLVHS